MIDQWIGRFVDFLIALMDFHTLSLISVPFLIRYLSPSSHQPRDSKSFPIIHWSIWFDGGRGMYYPNASHAIVKVIIIDLAFKQHQSGRSDMPGFAPSQATFHNDNTCSAVIIQSSLLIVLLKHQPGCAVGLRWTSRVVPKMLRIQRT